MVLFDRSSHLITSSHLGMNKYYQILSTSQSVDLLRIPCELLLRAERSNLIIWTHLLYYRANDLKIGTSSAAEGPGCGERLKNEVCRDRG
jgi:hypothetical protein